MKALVSLLCLGLLLFTLRAETGDRVPPGALGMTADALAVKYGAYGKLVPAERVLPAEHALQFTKNGVSIVAQMWRGRAAGISYFRVQNFQIPEIESLLAGNGAGWKIVAGTPASPMWRAAGLVAVYMADINVLRIETAEFTKAFKAAASVRVKGL